VQVTRALTPTEFKLRYFDSVLGYLWTLLRPLMLFGVLYLVFTHIVRFGDAVPHYPVMLLAATFEDAGLEPACPIDDPRQTPDAHIEEGAQPRQQEHRRDSQLDDLGQAEQTGGDGQHRWLLGLAGGFHMRSMIVARL